ncbi:Serine/threonine-protein phosphatase 7 long form [Glycine soja]
MASSSSCSSNISIISGPVEGDVLWMQDKHISQHIWNGEEDRKLHIRRAVTTYQGQEEISEEIIHLLRLHVDESPLIGPTNLSWVNLCEELLGVRPEEGELQGSMIKLSWLAHYFPDLNNHGGLPVHGSFDSLEVSYLLTKAVTKFREGSTYSWGSVVLGYLYREMCSATDYKTKSIGGMCILIQMWVWERCTTMSLRRTPPIIENKPLGHMWLRRGNQHIGNDDLKFFCRKLDIMKRHEIKTFKFIVCLGALLNNCYVIASNLFSWKCYVVRVGATNLFPKENSGQLLGPMINQWNNRADFRVDAYPRQEGLLSFNSDYMVWYRRKTKMFVDPKNANMATRCRDVIVHGVATREKYIDATGREFPAQPLNILPSSYSAQMYQYPFEAHQSDTSASEHSLGGVAETYANFSWPTMTLSQAIPNMDELLGVDLRHQFSLEADQHEERGHCGKRNPDRQVRRWDHGSSQSISFLIFIDFGRPFARIVVGLRISVHGSSEGGIAASFPRGHHCAK